MNLDIEIAKKAVEISTEYGYNHILIGEVFKKSRKPEYVFVRQLICFLLVTCKIQSNNWCANFFKQSHSTTNHSRKRISNLIETDRFFKDIIETLN